MSVCVQPRVDDVVTTYGHQQKDRVTHSSGCLYALGLNLLID